MDEITDTVHVDHGPIGTKIIQQARETGDHARGLTRCAALGKQKEQVANS
jgi:hypothetical protein